jgi:hypothetical protein
MGDRPEENVLKAAQLDTLSAEAQSVSLAAHRLVNGMKPSVWYRPRTGS